MRGFYRHVVLGGILALAGCGPRLPASDPAPVPAAELARLLPGHLVALAPMAPCDAGPLSFPAPGKYIWYNGFGQAVGTYRASDGAVELDPDKDGGERVRIGFSRDAKGTLLYAFPGNQPRPARLDPINAKTVAARCH